MTREEFQIQHSTLIEHYQFIEMHLEGIYATLADKPFLNGLQDVEYDSINRIIHAIQKEESRIKLSIFTEDEYQHLYQVLKRRNFWCHECYTTLLFDARTDAPKKAEDIQEMYDDLYAAASLREDLYQKKVFLMRSRKPLFV